MQLIKLSEHSDFDNYIPCIHDLFTNIIIEHVLIKVLLRRKFLFLFPSFFNINLLYMFKFIQIAKNWNDTCVRELEISH